MAMTENIRAIVDGTGRELFAIPYQHYPFRWAYVSVTANPALDRVYVQTERTFLQTNGGKALPIFLDIYDAKGTLLHTYNIPGELMPPRQWRWVDTVMRYGAPVGLVAGSEIYSWLNPSPRDMADETSSAALWWAGLGVIALVLATATFFWARDLGFSKGAALGWAGLVLVSGMAGLLAFRLATDWPVRIPCPSCGRKRTIEKERVGAAGSRGRCRRPMGLSCWTARSKGRDSKKTVAVLRQCRSYATYRCQTKGGLLVYSSPP